MASSSSLPLLLPLVLLLFTPHPSLAAKVAPEFLYPNFNASYFDFVDNSNTFLSSPPFAAVFYDPGDQSSRYYVTVRHTISGAAVWTANPASPVPSSAILSLTTEGLALTLPNGTQAWSTPRHLAPVAALQLLPSGELRLLNAANESLWSSFVQPTDTLLPNQLLPVSASLTSAADDTAPTPGDCRLLVTPNDVVLQWAPTSLTYWSLASDPRSTKDSNTLVAYLTVNTTGLYLLASDQMTAVFRLIFPPSPSSFPNEFQIAKLDNKGRFRIMSFSPNESLSVNAFDTDFVAPSSDCDLPAICGSLGLCAAGGNGSTCSCAASFGTLPDGGCSPAEGSVLATSSCRGDRESYVNLGSRIGYFGYKFSKPSSSGANLSACRDLCSANCSCLGFFYRKSSMSCYLLEHQIGSLFTVDAAGDGTAPTGYIKTIGQASPPHQSSSSSPARIIIVLLPSTATLLLVICLSCICLAMWRRKKQRGKPMSRTKSVVSGLRWPMTGEFTDEEEEEKVEEISIPGLPIRYTFAELEAATNNFQTRIGSGGFGCVFKGQLPDKSLVAVKRINAVNTQGRREFCTEIAVIGSIHHVNLVRLRGFCTHGPRRLLVYEYMNRGSLDRVLFGCGPVLEWRERVDIAIGASRGLAYLHAGCQQRVIHCDVKPENILLHDHNQVKIADFGLAKLMSPEQSGLFTTMRGTRGYLAPEWLTNAAISDKTDVYSFGMVLLEILRGRKNRAEESEPAWTGSSGLAGSGRPVAYFPMMALEMHERRTYWELADPRLEGRVEWAEMERVVRVALCCLHEEPALRPSMTVVAAMLEGTMPAAEPRSESLEYLRLYGRGSRDPNPVRRVSATATSTMTAGSSDSPLPSYLSSQDVSGPR